MRLIGKRIFGYAFSSLVYQVAQIIVFTMYYFFAGQEAAGAIEICFSVMSAVSIIGLIGLPSIAVAHVDSEARRSTQLRRIVATQVVSAILFVVIILSAIIIINDESLLDNETVCAFIVAGGLKSIMDMDLRLSRLLGAVDAFLIVAVSTGCGQIAVTFFLLLSGHESLFYIGTAFAGVFGIGVVCLFFFREGWSIRGFSFRLWRSSLPIGFAGFLGWCNRYADRYVLMSIGGPAMVGQYGLIVRLVAPVQLFLMSVVFPSVEPSLIQVADGSGKAMRIRPFIYLVSLVFALLGMTVLYLAPNEEIKTFFFLFAAAGFMFMSSLANVILWRHRKNTLTAFLTMIAIIVNLSTSIILVMEMGMAGAAVAASLAWAGRCVLGMIYADRVVNRKVDSST